MTDDREDLIARLRQRLKESEADAARWKRLCRELQLDVHDLKSRLALRQIQAALGDVGMILMPGPGWQNPTCPYACDNGVFHNWQRGRLWGQEMHCEWLAMLAKIPAENPPLWVLLPDAVMDWPRTLELITIYLPVVRAKGWPVAIALQNDCDFNEVLGFAPDWVFVGGDDDWKEANIAPACTFFQPHGIRVHVGRVNTIRRIRLCQAAGTDGCDGTTLNKFRDATLPVVSGAMATPCMVLPCAVNKRVRRAAKQGKGVVQDVERDTFAQACMVMS